MGDGEIRIAYRSGGAERKFRLIAQMGASDWVPDLPQSVRPIAVSRDLKERTEPPGLTLSVLEGYGAAPPKHIKLGLDDRDENLQIPCENLRNLGAAGINMLCYNWILVLDRAQSVFDIPTREGPLETRNDRGEMMKQRIAELGDDGEDG